MWADELGAAVEARWLAEPQLIPSLWLADRGVPPGTPGVGVGTDQLPDDAPDFFKTWAGRYGWSACAVLVARDWRGAVVGFQTRTIEPKAYNKYEVYPGVIPPLWGSDRALGAVWQSQHLILAEGPFDALACQLAGGRGVVATMGAAPGQGIKRWVRRLARRVTLLYDMDEAGREACRRMTMDLTEGGVIVSAPAYAAHDPWDLWVARPQALRGLVT
jgi:hypothetical protein